MTQNFQYFWYIGEIMELFNEIESKIQELTKSIQMLRQNGTNFAEAERDYKVKLRQEALKLRQDDKMPVTLIAQIIYGVPEVAQARFERDVKEATYKANQEHINVVKLQIKILNDQLDREWHSGVNNE